MYIYNLFLNIDKLKFRKLFTIYFSGSFSGSLTIAESLLRLKIRLLRLKINLYNSLWSSRVIILEQGSCLSKPNSDQFNHIFDNVL